MSMSVHVRPRAMSHVHVPCAMCHVRVPCPCHACMPSMPTVCQVCRGAPDVRHRWRGCRGACVTGSRGGGGSRTSRHVTTSDGARPKLLQPPNLHPPNRRLAPSEYRLRVYGEPLFDPAPSTQSGEAPGAGWAGSSLLGRIAA
eukprot:6724485-Prymnesium_polylepis.2